MKYFGFISLLEKDAIPDPTEAIERSLRAIFKSKTSWANFFFIFMAW